MKQKKVVFISRKWPPAVGGMETYSVRLCEELQKHADLVRIVLPGRSDGAPPSPVALIGFGIRAFWRLLLGERDADIVHIGDMASWPLALATLFRSRRPALVLSAHGTDVSFPRRGTLPGRLYARHLKFGARLLPRAQVIANSRATEAETRLYGFTQITVVPLASDFARQEQTPDIDKLLFAGRILPLKGLSWFVTNVLEHLPEGITLDVAGTIWDKDEARCLDHSRVTHIGHLDHKALARRYADSLAVVVPNLAVPSGQFEGFGLVAVEVAAAGGIVLASDHGGLSEAVIDGETGLTLPSGDARPWIDAIRDLRNWSAERRRQFTDKASATAHAHFSWERVARDTRDVYARSMKADAP